MSKIETNIAVPTAPDKALLRERRHQWAQIRPTRQEFDALRELWRDGLIEPSERFLDLIAPRDAFPLDQVSGEPGLIPEQHCLTFPVGDVDGLYVLSRSIGGLTAFTPGLERHEAHRLGFDAVRSSNAEFTLLNRQPEPGDDYCFSPRGLKCVVHPDGFGRWAWGYWGGDGIPSGGSGLDKAECVEHAFVCGAIQGELVVTNHVPLGREDWRTLYAS